VYPTTNAIDVVLLVEAIFGAAEVALSYFGRESISFWEKGDNSIVSEADLAVDRFMKTFLLARRPTYGWLSEESRDVLCRLKKNRVFVVDPIDGTRAFLSVKNDWVISAAIVEKGRPVVSVLGRPSKEFNVGGHILVACSDPFILNGSEIVSRGAYSLNGTRLQIPKVTSIHGATVSIPRLWSKSGDVNAFFDKFNISVLPYIPSLAMRLVSVLLGEADVVFVSSKSYDWDIAAVDLLICEAGGSLLTASGDMASYNTEFSCHEALVAMSLGLSVEVLKDFLNLRRSVKS